MKRAVESTEDFKARIAAIIRAEPEQILIRENRIRCWCARSERLELRNGIGDD